MLRLFSRLPLLLLLVATLHAQSVRWEPSGGTLALNQLSELSLIFDQCEPKGPVILPSVTGLTFGTPSRAEQSSFNIINGTASRSSTVTLTYRVRPATQQMITIPAFDVATDKGRKHVTAATFEIGAATVGQSNLSLEAVARSAFTLPSDSVWAGEVFPLKYTLNASKRYLYNLNKDFDWVSAPLAIEAWSNPDQIEAVLNEETRVSVIYKTRATIKTPGQVTLNPATHLVNITTGSSPFGMFTRPNLEQFAISTKPAALTVRPLPAPAPAGFTGAVGQFTLNSAVVPATASVGEPVTWTLTLNGTGNWPDLSGLPARSVSKDFRVVQPQAKRTPKDNSLFDASLTEDIVLIPTKAGPYTLGPVTFSYFDPKTGSYQTITTEPVTINVTPGAANTQPSTSGAQPVAPATAGSSSAPPPAVSPQQPASIPRDPLPPASSADAPLPASALHLALISSVACPLLAWAWLAMRRARATDPRLPQRMARLRLASTLNTLRNATDTAQITALLQQWQCDTALLWQIDTAVPTADQFPSEDWAELWTGSERVLYRAGANLPHDWISHAQQSLAAKRVPAFSALQLFLPRNLIPCLAALLLSAFILIPSSFAADGRSAYAKGDFAAAAATWQDALKTNPLDWSAHHDLSLTLVQQNQWGQAAGHSLAAFVQRPGNASVRWHLGFALKGAGLRPAEVAPFIEPDALHSLALRASPSCWQFTLIASAWIAALGLGLWFWSAYGGPRWFKPAAWSLLVITALFAAAAGSSLHLYGTLADNRAVFVVKSTTLRSIPTDLDTPQKSAPLAAGLIAVTDKTFLGWKRLSFPNGQTGWVRAEDLVALWKTP